MTTTDPRGGRGPLFAGLLSLLFLAAPAFVSADDSYGPLYTSAGQIVVAQRVLLAEHFLKPGRYTTGRMDEATIDALRSFQRQHFVPATGVLDQETMAQLMSHLSAREIAQARLADSSARADRERASLRTMPETAGPIPLVTGLGALLLGGGLLLLRRGRS